MNLSLFNRLKGSLYGSLLNLNPQDDHPATPLNRNSLLEITQTLGQTGPISEEQWDAIARKNPDKSSALLCWIPLALFWHDYPAARSDLLQSLMDKGWLSLADTFALQTWSQILTAILRERFYPEPDFFPSIPVSSSVTPLSVTMQAIHQRLPLSDVIQSVNDGSLSSAIALSLYCFIDTPTNFVLSLKRASQCPHSLVLPFTGALAGAYHGLIGIPLTWRLTIETLLSPAQLSEICDGFWQRWSGSLAPPSSLSATLLASPRVIQRRSHPPLISQSQYFP
ncbi:MAG: ADP-ribosylglycohydrolase family protein [Snowella sp.]|nr:ADP-ribosylglycohydrolase family protein [Snowella sp.]